MLPGLKRFLAGLAILVLFLAGLLLTVLAAAIAISIKQGQNLVHPEYLLSGLVFMAILAFGSVYIIATPRLNKPDDEGWKHAEWVGYKYGVPFSFLLCSWLIWGVLTVTIAVVIEPILLRAFAGGNLVLLKTPTSLKILVVLFLSPGLIAITNFLRSNLRSVYPDVPLVWVDGEGISIAGKAKILWQGITQIDLTGGNRRFGGVDGYLTIKSDAIASLGKVKINTFGSLWSKCDLMWKLRDCAQAHGVVLQRSIIAPPDPNKNGGAGVDVYNS